MINSFIHFKISLLIKKINKPKVHYPGEQEESQYLQTLLLSLTYKILL